MVITGPEKDGTYFVRGRKNEAEMVRLLIQESYVTEGMGGPLSEQPAPEQLHDLLDVGCGPGGWAIETARLYPHARLAGVDINQGMITYALAEAQAQQLSTRVTFLVMDARGPFDFPDNTFDLVNMRLAASFLRIEDWPKILQEFRRITRPAGILRITDGCTVQQTNSFSCNRLGQMLLCAGYKAGHNLTVGRWGVTDALPGLLTAAGCQRVQTRRYILEHHAGTVGGEKFAENMMIAYQNLLPFLNQYHCAEEDYDAIYQQAISDLQRPDFEATQEILTVWGTLPT